MKFWTVFLLLVGSFYASAQLKVSDVLSKPVSEDEMIQVLAREDYLATHKFNSPWLREVDIRARSNDREVGLEDYRVRFSLINPLEIKANRDYRKLILSQQSLERRKSINEILYSRYELIVESYYIQSALSSTKNYIKSLQEIEKISMSEIMDIGDVIDIEQEITKQQILVSNLQMKQNVLAQAFEYSQIASTPDFQDFDWITVDQILNIIHREQETPSLELLSEQAKLEQEESIMTIKKAEAFSNIGFIQAEYDIERGGDIDDHLGFQIGVSVPIFNSDKPDLQRRELELIEERAEYKEFEKAEQREDTYEALRLEELASQVRLIQSKEGQLANLKRTIAAGEAGLSEYKKLAEYEYYLRSKLNESQMQLRYRFLQALKKSGDLDTQPYTNYLSQSLTQFDLILNF
ncbi:MAG: hypothetical protein ABJ004_07970 [Cyclobacteriaceae bacterium]